jgi:universal stress protein A
MRFKKLLVAVDFSEPSQAAFHTAAQLAADAGAQLVIVHVFQPASYTGPLMPVAATEDAQRDARASLAALERQAESVGARRVSSALLTGTPWHEIVELARKDEAIDLVVLGTHGHTGLKHVLIGSVAERVVRHAPCPVLVVRTRM